MTKLTKTAVTLSVMQANTEKPMAEVVKLIVAAQHEAGFFSITEALAAGAYRWAVRTGKALGVVPPKTATAKAPKAPKIAKPKPAPKPVAEKPLGTDEIRAANLAKIREVHARMKAQGHFQDVPKKPETIPTVETDSFAAPAFLTMDEVNALV